MIKNFEEMVSAEVESFKRLVLALDSKVIHQIVDIANVLEKSIARGGCIYFCGNGGSCSQSEHFAAELIGRYSKERKPVKAISLSSDTSVISCIANDFGFDKVFSRQLEALGCERDCLIMLSTSGRSPNILEVSKTARILGLKSILLTGSKNSHFGVDADIVVRIDSNDTARIQEAHLLICHVVCKCIDATLAE